MKRTYQPKKKDVTRNWHLVDAKGKILGRMSSDIAKFLTGKHKATYSAHMDMGDYVVVINAEKVEVTGRKKNQKVYYSHSGYPGGFKKTAYKKLMEDSPEKVIEKAVSGMLPRNRLHKDRIRRMKVFAGSEHPYSDKFVENK